MTCRLGGAPRPVRLFVKYGTRRFDGVYGHRGDLAYEAEVYRAVLGPLRLSTPALYGIHRDPRSGAPWLILEYLDGGTRASWMRSPRAMVDAARWIGTFHAANARRWRSPPLAFLRRYDAPYYVGWARRASRLLRPFRARYPWAAPLCRRSEVLLPRLERAPQTVIHGEYFGQNILYQRSRSRPMDWQSTAVAPGEIDLAALTHSWPAPVAAACVRAYRRSRWPHGAPEGFGRTLELARLYTDVRWLGDPGLMEGWLRRPDPWLPKKALGKFLRDFETVGVRLGLTG